MILKRLSILIFLVSVCACAEPDEGTSNEDLKAFQSAGLSPTSSLTTLMRPGFILLTTANKNDGCRGGTSFEAGILGLVNTKYCHAALVQSVKPDEIQVIDAMPKVGVTVRTVPKSQLLEYWKYGRVAVLNSGKSSSKILERARSFLGTPFRYPQEFSPSHPQRGLYCSMLVGLIFESLGIELKFSGTKSPIGLPSWISPDDIYSSKKLYRIISNTE
jgi:cell wall-associated NlpC family hydrolase